MKVLVVVDMQNDFIDGSLGTKEAQAIVPNVVKKIKNCDSNTIVLFTKDTHFGNYLETQEGKNLPVQHCIYNTHGWRINNEVSKVAKPKNGFMGNLYASRDIVNSRIHKNSFGSITLAGVIEEISDIEGVESIELIGLCTDICVISNAMILKAAFPETPITVDASCCAGVTPDSHKNALEAMKMCQINIINEEV